MLFRAKAVAARLTNGAFTRNVLVVMTGSVIGQAVGFALSPVISRLFTPADFGLFGSFGAVTGVVAAIATLDYSQAIMLPKRREDAGQLFLLSCLATIVVTAVCAAACVLAPGWLTGLLNTDQPWLLALLVVAVLAGGLNAALQAWCVRVKAFKHTSASQVVRGVSSNGLQVGFGLAHSGALGLVVSTVVADFMASMNLLRVTRSDIGRFREAAAWRRLRELAFSYRDFPLYSATQNLLNGLSTGLPVLLLSHYFGIAIAGAYAFGTRLLAAPISLLLGALRQVLFQRAAEMQHEERALSPLFLKSTLALFAIGLPAAMVLGAWAPQIFTWVFGEQWRIAGHCARYLVFWHLFALCNLPAVLFARLIRIQRALFFFNAVLLTLRVFALVVGGMYLTALQTVAVFSLLGGAMNVALILLVGRALLKREATLDSTGVRYAFAALRPE